MRRVEDKRILSDDENEGKIILISHIEGGA